MIMYDLVNIAAAGKRFSGNNGAGYVVGSDGVIKNVLSADLHDLITQGFQLNAANPLRIPFLGYFDGGEVQIPISSCVFASAAPEAGSVTFLLPKASDCPGAFFYFNDTGVAGDTILQQVAGDTINGSTDPLTNPASGVLYSDGISNFIPL